MKEFWRRLKYCWMILTKGIPTRSVSLDPPRDRRSESRTRRLSR